MNSAYLHGTQWYFVEEAAKMEEWQMQVLLFRMRFGVTLSSRDEMQFYLATGKVPNDTERKLMENGVSANTIMALRATYAIDGVSELWQKFKPNRQTTPTETQSSTSGMIPIVNFKHDRQIQSSVTNVINDTTRKHGVGIIPCTNTLSLSVNAANSSCKR